MPGVQCPQCHGRTEIAPAAATAAAQPLVCGHCQTTAMVEVFPALVRGRQPVRLGVATGGDEAACFFHAEKRAEAACDQCGRYVCALCDVEVGDRHFCPYCFGGDGRGPAHSGLTERQRALPGRSAFWTAALGWVLGPLALITGPIAIYLAVRGLRAPRTVTGGRATGLAIAALILGFAETIIWLVLVIVIFVGVWSEATR